MQGQGNLTVFSLAKQSAMSSQLTISQLAKAAGIPTTTIRYYERIGLVEPENRSAGNYRMYSERSPDRLKSIRAAQPIGFTLDDIRALLSDGGRPPRRRDVQHLIEDRLAEIDQRLKHLRHVQRVLKTALAKCQTSNPRRACHVVESLQH